MKKIAVAVAIIAILGWFSASVILADDTTGTTPVSPTMHAGHPGHPGMDIHQLPPFVRYEIMKKYDTNHDGKLDESERAQIKADMQAERKDVQALRAEHKSHCTTPTNTSGLHRHRPITPTNSTAFTPNSGATSDTNRGGKMGPKGDRRGREEMELRRWALLLYDANHDGKLDETERAQMKADREAFRAAHERHHKDIPSTNTGGVNPDTNTNPEK